MDPEAAVDIMKDATIEAEGFIKSALALIRGVQPHPEKAAYIREYKNKAREALDEAGDAQGDLSMWMSRGGFKPRRYDTWLRRYVKAEQAWSALSKAS